MLIRLPILRPGDFGINSFDNVTDEPSAILEAATIFSGPVVSAQELMAKVAVALFDIDKVISNRRR